MNVKVAVVQSDPKLGDISHNLNQTLRRMDEAAAHGARLIVFPECSLTGYCFENEEEARQSALRLDDERISQLTKAAAKTGATVIVGLVEQSERKLFNSMLVIGPEGIIGNYRKAHLPELGVDRFAEAGSEPFRLIETPVGRIGALICYDVRFPEQARILSLRGADMLVHITNLPLSASAQVDYLLPARANENRVFVLTSDRVGEERGFRFLGRSSIFGVDGETLVQANQTDETIVYAELDLNKARNKKVFYPAVEGKPVDHVNDLLGARRPELYRGL